MLGGKKGENAINFKELCKIFLTIQEKAIYWYYKQVRAKAFYPEGEERLFSVNAADKERGTYYGLHQR
ncbi:hypothetical protein D7X94_06510 [Acutalibacter sp. 1XD8-33]|nr:hypothetical protein D7X94_06510 [Acutalibacter sp. 1XD8-33]